MFTLISRNQKMISGGGSTPKLKDEIEPTSTLCPSGSDRRSGENFARSLGTPSIPLSASDVASPSHSSIDENDIIIAVMGPTGAGKSSFVNTAAGRTGAVIGHSLKSQTRVIQPVRCPHPDGRRNIVLVDTPGFNDTYLSDVQILKLVANWLKVTYQNNIKLSGILYLHRISDVRLAGTPLKNLAIFRDLCGDDSLKNIVLVTTMWDELEDQSVGSEREEELLSKYWKAMIHLGSRTCRFQGTRASAWEIVNCLDSRQMRTPLQIQREMVDLRLPLEETAAAKTLFRFLATEFKKVWARMRHGVRGRTGARRPPSEGSTIGSGSSVSDGWSVLSTGSSSNSSYYTTHPTFSPTESTSSGCSANGRREALLAMIVGLRIAHQMADIASIPMLRGAIGTVLQIAQMIEGMGGTHHAISEVIEYSGWLLEEIAHYVAGTKLLSKEMKKTLNFFRKELKNLQDVVKKISTRGPIARFFLYDADIQAIAACTAAVRAIYDKLEVRLAMDNLQAVARLEERLTALCNSTALWQCECGRSVIQEQSRENARPSTSQSCDH